MEVFEDELGSIKVYSTYVERERDEDVWDEMDDKVSGLIIDRIHYSEVEELKCQSESAPPVIEVKLKDGWRKMPFSNSETCKKTFKRLKYHWNVFQENF